MRERPILFSGPMVRALLDGTKTQTRRVCKAAQFYSLSAVVEVPDPQERGQVYNGSHFGDEDGEVQFASPYGGPGDRLWVREAWKAHTTFDHLPPRDIPQSHVWYMAEDGYKAESRHRQSMFMPRWASRLTLEITGVRVERLQDISEADAKAEGADCLIWSGVKGGAADLIDWPLQEVGNPYRNGYALLWEAINGDDTWGTNPFVWVYEFRRLP